MARNGQKKKGGFFQRIIMGSEKAEGYARSTLPSNRWELGWDIFKGRFWKLVLINLMLLVGCAGIIFVWLMMYVNTTAMSASLPFGQNFGVGYPFIAGLESSAMTQKVSINFTGSCLLVPGFLLLGVVCSGVFYIMRNLVWTEGVFLANDFWRGLKQNISQILPVMLLYSVMLLISSFSLNQISWLEFNGLGNFWFGFSRVAIYIVMVLLTIMLLYAMTISVTYKLGFWALLKNSFLLTIGLLPQNLFFLLLMIAPALLALLISVIAPFILMIYAFFYLAAAVLIWTDYSHWVFDRFINDRVEGAEKNRGIYSKVDVKGNPVAKKKKAKSGFANPKKKKKAETVPEPELTELATSFSRADLERLDREKKALADAIEHNAEAARENEGEEDEPDEYEESDGSEGYEDALRLDGADDEEYADDEAEEEPEELSDLAELDDLEGLDELDEDLRKPSKKSRKKGGEED